VLVSAVFYPAVDAIEAAFAARGIRASCAGSDAWNDRLLVAERGDVTVTVPPQLGQQLTQELMTIRTPVDVVAALMGLVAGGLPVDELHMLFCDERGAWPGRVLKRGSAAGYSWPGG
jgi:hypothetical protein